MKSKRYEKNSFTNIVKKSSNLSDIEKRLELTHSAGNRQTIKKYIKKYGINISHFRIDYSKRKYKKKIELSKILVENSTYGTKDLKKRLYDEGLKKRKCELCGQNEIWQEKKMSLILDHVNGINNDNRIENLRIVCPNCNATLPTHGGKNIKLKYKSYHIKKIIEKKHCECGALIHVNAIHCKKCDSYKQRKVDRPPYEQLKQEVEKFGYSATGRKYGVSDNTIRKWIKYYKKHK